MSTNAKPPSRTGRRQVPVGETSDKLKRNLRAEEYEKWQIFLREELSKLFRVFYWINGSILSFMVVLLLSDCGQAVLSIVFPNFHPHVYLTEKILLALIAATAAQLGALAFSAGLAMFRQIHAKVDDHSIT